MLPVRNKEIPPGSERGDTVAIPEHALPVRHRDILYVQTRDIHIGSESGGEIAVPEPAGKEISTLHQACIPTGFPEITGGQTWFAQRKPW
jgi:hypothetical protein